MRLQIFSYDGRRFLVTANDDGSIPLSSIQLAELKEMSGDLAEQLNRYFLHEAPAFGLLRS